MKASIAPAPASTDAQALDDSLGDAPTIERRADDAARVAGPFAAGIEASDGRAFERLRIAQHPHRARRPRLDTDDDRLARRVALHRPPEATERRAEPLGEK